MEEEQLQNIIDYTELINGILENQNTIIEQNNELLKSNEDIKWLRDFLEVTPEEQQALDKQSEKELNIQKELEKEQKIQQKEEYIEFLSDSPYSEALGEIKTELQQLNKLNNETLEVNTVSSTSSYLLLFGVVAVVLLYGVFRAFIKPFI